MAVVFDNVHFRNLHTGISTRDPRAAILVPGARHLHMQNLTFDNVAVPFDVQGLEMGRLGGTRIINDPKVREIGRPSAGALTRDANPRSMKGWRKASGAPLPVFCPNCKSISPSRNYVFGSAYFHAWDNEEQCPECGKFGARLSEGLFDLANEIALIVEGPDISYAMLEAVSKATSDILNKRTSPEQAIEEIRKINPRFASMLAAANTFGVAAVAYVGLLISIYTAQYAPYAKTGVDLAQEQIDIARQQAASPNQDAIATQKLLEKLLDSLSHMHVVPDGGNQSGPPKEEAEPGAEHPAQRKAPREAGPPHLSQKPSTEQAQPRHGKSPGHERSPANKP